MLVRDLQDDERLMEAQIIFDIFRYEISHSEYRFQGYSYVRRYQKFGIPIL